MKYISMFKNGYNFGPYEAHGFKKIQRYRCFYSGILTTIINNTKMCKQSTRY